MKIVTLVIAFFSVITLSACVDIEEFIVINEDNSGTYTLQLDMSKMIEMASQMGAGEAGSKKMEKMDSTFFLKEKILAADNLTAAEKDLYQDVSMKVKVDKASKEIKIVMTCPFKSINNLPEIKENLFTIIDKLKVLDKMAGKGEEAAAAPADDAMSEKAISPGSDKYKFIATPGKIEYKLIEQGAATATPEADSTMMMLKGMMSFMGEMTYKTNITAARPVKNYSGNKATVSADKRTISFSYTFTEILEKPGISAYQMEY